jgi:hypothetical protein
MTSTDLNRYFSRNDKILECCICNKEFLLIKYQPNGLATPNFEDLEDGESEKPDIYHFIIFRISKIAKLMKIDDSWEKMDKEDGETEKFHVKLHSIVEQIPGLGAEYKGFLVKFYTFSGDKAYLNFWKLNNYGRFTNEKAKFLVGENLKPVKPNCSILIKEVKQGLGYDYVTFSDDTSFRIVYNR